MHRLRLPHRRVRPGGAAPAVGEIKGLVFDDKNKNAILEAGDTGMAGQTVAIVTPDGEKELRSTTTGADGTFTFDKLEAGRLSSEASDTERFRAHDG